MIDHPRTTPIPDATLLAPTRRDSPVTVGDHVLSCLTEGRCIGYLRYSRTPGRIVWFTCLSRAPEGYDRCGQCVIDDHEARSSEAIDTRARAEHRAKLRQAVAGLRYEWTEPLLAIKARELIRDIEAAVRNAPGGSGNYWLALRLLAEMD